MIKAILAVGATALFLWLVPPFHIVRLRAAQQLSAEAAFNAPAFVEKLWKEKLIPSTSRAADATQLIAALQKDPKTARTKYGRTVGLSDTCYYFVSGVGRVVAVTNHCIALALNESGTAPDITLETGNIFGNAVRDATGLLNVNDFPNSQDFNDISSEINRRIEERVLPPLRAKAILGARVHFAGCAEVSSEDTELHPLHLVPLVAEVQ